MTFFVVLWMSWMAMVGMTAALYGYNAMLVHEEEGHFVLPVGFAHPIHHRITRTQLERRVDHLRPLLESCEVLTAFVTMLLIGYYVDWAIRAVFV
jgi:hypothetical protein